MDFLRAVLALALTLGLIGLASVGLRRYAPGLVTRIQARTGVVKRMQILETLVLGPTQRLLLIRVGETERVILLGEGRELSATAAAQAPKTEPAKPAKSSKVPASRARS